MAYDWKSILGGAGQLGAGIGGLFGMGNKNPQDEANKYLNQIPGQTSQYFDPYSQGGQKKFGELGDQSSQLMNDPGGKYNQIGQGFQQSPGFKFAMEQALGGANRSAAAGGMAGTPQNTQQDMQLANDLASQDYYKYMEGATGLYGKGLDSANSMSQMGLNAGTSQADMIAQMLAKQGQNAYTGAKESNQNKGNAFSNILGGIGSFASGFL